MAAPSGADDIPELPETIPEEALPPVPAEVPEELAPLWHVLLRVEGRTPSPRSLELWGERLARGMDARTFLRQLVASRRFRATKFVRMHSPPGHFFSPVVDPDAVRDYVERARRAGPADIAGIRLDLDAMEAFWRAHRERIATTPFTRRPAPGRRYHYGSGPYNYGDAILLRVMIAHWRPRRVIEIGSGVSSACMLDSAEEFGLEPFRLTCIEPYPARLRAVLKPEDARRVIIHERPVQDLPLDLFRELEPGDFLFIDSSHVLKTGSDVHYELFHILPALRAGVLVHFHDCRFPFEYSDTQIFEKNYSWNEAYAVRALLMHSTRYEVFFWGSLFAAERRALVAETSRDFLFNPGSALWVRVT